MGMEINAMNSNADFGLSRLGERSDANPLSSQADDSSKPDDFGKALDNASQSKQPLSERPEARKVEKGEPPQKAAKSDDDVRVEDPQEKKPIAKPMKALAKGAPKKQEVPLSEKAPQAEPEVEADDKQSLIAKSYESAVVSYPVSQIAPDALKPEVKDDLKAKGLWDQQGVYMAVAAPELLAMKQVLANPVEKPIAKPVAQFMASMENELGVSPERIVQAFQKLSPGQLQKNPKETMNAVIKNLDLDSKDQAKAVEIYSKLLAQMQVVDEEQPMQPLPMAMPALMAKPVEKTEGPVQAQAQPQPLSQKEPLQGLQPQSLQKGVQAAQEPQAPKVTSQGSKVIPQTVLQGVSQPTAEVAPAIQDMPVQPIQTSQVAQAVQQMKKPVLVKEANVKESALSMNSSGSEQNTLDVPEDFSLQGQSANGQENPAHQNQRGLDQQPQDLRPQLDAKPVPSQNAANQSIQKEIGLNSYKKAEKAEPQVVKPNAETAVNPKLKLNDVEGSIQQQQSAQVQSDASAQSTTQAADKPAHAAGAAVPLTAHADNSKGVRQVESVREVMNAAQALATKGGGEMTVNVKNQDLGHIHLKVAARGSDVQISMVAEHTDTKRLLEQNLSDLKSGLNSHGLNAESIRVSVAERGSGSDLSKNPQQHPDFGAQREFQQAFQQFNKDRQDYLSSFMTPGMGLGPVSNRIPNRTFEGAREASSRLGVSSRLNVMA